MKSKSQGILLSLLILIMTSCGTLNNSRFFGFQQGKNKVIDCNFEAQNDFEVANEIIETEQVQPALESNKQENTAPSFVEAFTSAPNNKENLDEPFNIAVDDCIIETIPEESENLVTENIIETQPDRPARTRNEFMAIVLILVLAAFALVFVIGLFSLLG